MSKDIGGRRRMGCRIAFFQLFEHLFLSRPQDRDQQRRIVQDQRAGHRDTELMGFGMLGNGVITAVRQQPVSYTHLDVYKRQIYSQMLLSIQLPITVFTQVYLTSSKKVMGVYVNSRSTTILLIVLGAMVTILNIALLISLF